MNMARLSFEHPNFLLLDEPTNHLDIFTKQILFHALLDYKGTLLLVSHDRWFIEKLNCKVLEMSEGKATLYSDYAAFRNVSQIDRDLTRKEDEPVKKKQDVVSARDIRKQKAEFRQKKAELENRIEVLENEEKELQCQIEDPINAVNAELLTDLCTRLDQVKNELNTVIDEYLDQYAD